MKTSFIATAVGVLTGATLLLCTAPAMAHDRIGFAVSVGLPVAPVVYTPPTYAPPIAVYGSYGPVVQFGAPYYYRDHGWWSSHDSRYGHGYRGWHR